MYKQQPKSPMLKALKGNQGKLPQQLQDAIKAAPESPAKQTKTLQKIKRTPETEGEKKAAQRAAQAKISSDSTYTYNQLRESNSWYGEAGKASAEAVKPQRKLLLKKQVETLARERLKDPRLKCMVNLQQNRQQPANSLTKSL